MNLIGTVLLQSPSLNDDDNQWHFNFHLASKEYAFECRSMKCLCVSLWICVCIYMFLCESYISRPVCVCIYISLAPMYTSFFRIMMFLQCPSKPARILIEKCSCASS